MHMSQLGFRLIDYLGNELGCSDKTSNHFDLDPSEKYFDGNEAESTEEEISEFFEALLTSSDTNSSPVNSTNHSLGETLTEQVSEGGEWKQQVLRSHRSTTTSNAAETAVVSASLLQTPKYASVHQVPLQSDTSYTSSATVSGNTSEDRPLRSDDQGGDEPSVCRSVSGYV